MSYRQSGDEDTEYGVSANGQGAMVRTAVTGVVLSSIAVECPREPRPLRRVRGVSGIASRA